MDYTLEQRCRMIIESCLTEKERNPIVIFEHIAKMDFVRMHGPEHHVLDGAALLTAFVNAGGSIDLPSSLSELMQRGMNMPGAACGMWGVCGAVSSLGAALSIIDSTGPLSTDGSWESHMRYTSRALERLAEVGGPRCCKRDAFLAFLEVIHYVNDHYDVTLETTDITCSFYAKNQQCIGQRCPFRRP